MKHRFLSSKKKSKAFEDFNGIRRILTDKTDFDTIETYKSIRTNIMFSVPKTDKGKVIVITSSVPGEGKTTTSINLAITFAQMGAKVLLMDCDLRRSRVHRYLKIEKKVGVSNVLCGFAEFENAVKKGIRPNLDCLTSGEIPPNPAELLGTEEFENLLEKLKEQYDYIFIDTPPVTVVTDAAVIMKNGVGVVMVVRQNVTVYDMLDDAMEDIEKTNAKLLGLVVLGIKGKAKKYGYYKKSAYGYGHKYAYKYEDTIAEEEDEEEDE